jgi:GDPmannose 4,6-dehydratase
MHNKTALITGVTGQDGSYLAKLLIDKNYKVYGSTRDPYTADLSRLDRLGISSQVSLVSLNPSEFRSVACSISKIMPTEIYHLAGQTSVQMSFEHPVDSIESISIATLNFLEAIRFLNPKIRFFNSGSSECFGDTGNQAADESSEMKPRSPYAVAKCSALWQVKLYREAYGLHACTGILSNHESPLRHRRFVTQKIINQIKELKHGNIDKIELGNLKISRDWGWAPDYVKAMKLMLESENPKDYIIATGHTSSLSSFINAVALLAGVEIADKITSVNQYMRPSDISTSMLSPKAIYEDLGWRADHSMEQMAFKMYHGILF